LKTGAEFDLMVNGDLGYPVSPALSEHAAPGWGGV
jgi:hypothetical protein